ncbi:MAG: hypothetical protein E6J77_03820 [Deltaproteobacteria bacterium]|nr:MAG: hypothetical protein E6J77_03820 [Deltaproteobacteria bacterium]
MEHASPGPEHPNDADLLEALLRRESHPHLTGCPRCAERAETIAREIDPLRSESAREPFDGSFYRRQAAAIEARITAGDGSRWSLLAPLPRLAWAAAAVAAVLTVAVGLSRPPLGGRGPAYQGVHPLAGSVDRARRARDRADDRLLRDIDQMLDEDPYDVDLGDG